MDDFVGWCTNEKRGRVWGVQKRSGFTAVAFPNHFREESYRSLSFLKSGIVRRTWTRRIKESKYLRYTRLLQPEPRIWSREEGALPGCLIIGAQRSGTTFLHDLLALRTSAVRSPLQKEIHFFDNKYYRGVEWYAQFFESLRDRPPAAKNFEASPYYLYHPAVPERVRESLPGVKVVAVLRDPVERAISQYKWIRQAGLETRGAVEAFQYDAERLGWEQDPEYLGRFEDPLYFDFDHIHLGYLRRSLYDVQLHRWRQHFSASQIRVVGSNTLFEHPETVVDELVPFLGIERDDHEGGRPINQNSSRTDTTVPPEALEIAAKHLGDVASNVRGVVTDEMIVGEDLRLGQRTI